MHVTQLRTPIGKLTLTASDAALTGVFFPSSRAVPPPPTANGGSGAAEHILTVVKQQLLEYFAGQRTTFDIALEPAGSRFERRVWELLQGIPYGHTTSYGELARRLGDATSARAVGAANGKNPIPIIVPCHRVIGANGDLTGFGGGIETKRWLLQHEGALLL